MVKYELIDVESYYVELFHEFFFVEEMLVVERDFFSCEIDIIEIYDFGDIKVLHFFLASSPEYVA